MDEGDYERAMALAKKAGEDADRVKRQHEETIKIIQLTWGKLSEAKRLGVDADYAELLLSRAREAVKSGEYENAVMYARRSAGDMADKLKNK
jgi:hypothetical protein